LVVSAPFRVRVDIFANDSSYGPGEFRAGVDHPKHLGVSAYANEAGEFFMTLPYNHPAISEIKPYETHWRVRRRAGDGVVQTIGAGFIDDFEADKNEVTIFGLDYMGLLETTVSSASTSYTSMALGDIVEDQLTAAMAETDSRLGFTQLGTVQATSRTATLITNYQQRLDFLRGVADVSMADRSVRTILSIGRTPNSSGDWVWNFVEDQGDDQRDIRLEYGKAIRDFRFSPGFREFATHIAGVGIKREGAAVLYSTQSYASTTTYGRITIPNVYQDIVNQTALDDRVKRDARRAARTKKHLVPVIRQGAVTPWTGWELGDSVPVIVDRGAKVAVDDLRTIWGMEWVVEANSQEALFLALEPKEI
jgi:hypothetical protein